VRAVAALLLAAVATACTGGGSAPAPTPTALGESIRVPDLTGASVRTAVATLGRQHLWGDVPRAVVDDLPAGTVTGQRPAAGTRVDSYTLVHLTLSAGPHPAQDTLQVATCDLNADTATATARPCVGGVVLVPIRSPAAAEICAEALQGRVLSAKATTLAEVRRTNIGGPPPGLTPGRHAFLREPGDEPAAWCWTAATTPSPGAEGDTWTLYVAIAGGRATSFFTMGGSGEPRPGPPSIP
jgi:hypothetical protein